MRTARRPNRSETEPITTPVRARIRSGRPTAPSAGRCHAPRRSAAPISGSAGSINVDGERIQRHQPGNHEDEFTKRHGPMRRSGHVPRAAGPAACSCDLEPIQAGLPDASPSSHLPSPCRGAPRAIACLVILRVVQSDSRSSDDRYQAWPVRSCTTRLRSAGGLSTERLRSRLSDSPHSEGWGKADCAEFGGIQSAPGMQNRQDDNP